MSSSSFQTQLQRVGAWVADLKYEDIPEEVIKLAKWQLLDAISAICAGSRSTVGQKLTGVFNEIEGGNYTVLPRGQKWSWENAVYVHSSLINALELDHFTFMGHIGQSSISAPLTIGEMMNATGKEFLVAMIAAQEIGGRMGGYMATGPQQGHMRAFIHRATSAVAACKLYGADGRITTQAMAIALSAPEFPLYPSSFSPETKVTCTSPPTVEGIRSAFLAMGGLDAPVNIVEHAAGLIAYFSYLSKVPDIWGQLGESWIPYSLSFKNFASCAYAQGPVNAALQIREQLGDIHPKEIDAITIYAPLVSVVMEKFSVPHNSSELTPVNTQFSNRRSVALALQYGAPTGEFYRSGIFEEKASFIDALAQKTELRHDWQLTIDLIRSVDQGLRNPGRPGVLSLGASGTAMNRFRKAFGSRPLLQWGDIPELYQMKTADRNYLFNRLWKAYRSRLPFWTKSARSNYHSTEGDLSKMQFSLGGRVVLKLKSGKEIVGICKTPPGFAGDNNKLLVAEAKYFREVNPVWGEARAKVVKDMIMSLPDISIRELLHACTRA